MLLAQRYELVRVVGQGGMGQVWLAKDNALEGTQVAVKLLPAELWSDQHARATVIQEAKLSLKLSHPNILRVVNLEPGDPPFLVMEYLEGTTLADEVSRRKLVNEGPFLLQEALPLIEALAGALDHAHALDILHRDVKPSNILLVPAGDGRFTPKLADFGIAAELKRLKSKPGASPTGTIAYMSPEQLTSQKLDLRADVYSLAATAYQMLTLDMPGEPGRVAIPESIPKFVADVLHRGLAADRDARPGTAGSLAKDLKMGMLRHEMLAGSHAADPVVRDAAPIEHPKASSYVSRPTGRVQPSSSDVTAKPADATDAPTRPPWMILATAIEAMVVAVAVIAIDQGRSPLLIAPVVTSAGLFVATLFGVKAVHYTLLGVSVAGLCASAAGTVWIASTAAPGITMAWKVGFLVAIAARLGLEAWLLARPAALAFSAGEKTEEVRAADRPGLALGVCVLLLIIDLTLTIFVARVMRSPAFVAGPFKR